MLLEGREEDAFGDVVPLIEAVSAAAGGGVLRKEDRVTFHRGLLAVVRNHGGCESSSDEVLRVGANGG